MATEQITLRAFIHSNELSPEDGGRGIEWFRPDEMMFERTQRKDENTELHLFSDGATWCAILDTATTSILMGEDDLATYFEEA